MEGEEATAVEKEEEAVLRSRHRRHAVRGIQLCLGGRKGNRKWTVGSRAGDRIQTRSTVCNALIVSGPI